MSYHTATLGISSPDKMALTLKTRLGIESHEKSAPTLISFRAVHMTESLYRVNVEYAC